MRKLSLTVLVMTLIALAACPVTVRAWSGVGEIRIEPHGSYYPLPIMLASPATFNITATDHSTAYCPIILLVMTNASYQGLNGDVVVKWEGGSIVFPKTSFEAVDSGYIPRNGTTNGARYQVSSLKEHIGVNVTEDDTLYYVYGPFLSRPIDKNPQTFNVTLPSTHARMLVYALGKSHHPCHDPRSYSIECCPIYLFDMRVPPTMAGFVVPDLATILLALAPFSAFGLYAVTRRKK